MRYFPHFNVLVPMHGCLNSEGDHYICELFILLAKGNEFIYLVFELVQDVGLLKKLWDVHVRVFQQGFETHYYLVVDFYKLYDYY